jgi:prolipoprotein diacylglyceryltransferase
MIDGNNTKDGVLIQPGFMEIYLITLFEGLILSLMLFIFSVMAVVILQMRDRKKMFLRETRV